MNDKILLKNMMFYGYHGVYDYEREHGQRFYVDVELTLNFTAAAEAAESDDLDLAVNYVAVYDQIKVIFETQRFQLLEALANCIVKRLLQQPIRQVTVRVRKPGVPLPGQIDYVEVETTRMLS